MLDENNLNYVIYYKDDNMYHVYNKNYSTMRNLKIEDGEVETQTIGNNDYKQLELDNDFPFVYVAVEGFSEEQLVNLFMFDGTIGLYSQGYEGMMSSTLFIILVGIIIFINYIYINIYVNIQKEKIGILKMLGYNTFSITKRMVFKMALIYTISLVLVMLLNINYITFIMSQYFIFSDSITIIITYLLTIVFTLLISGALIYYLISKYSAVEFLRKLSYG